MLNNMFKPGLRAICLVLVSIAIAPTLAHAQEAQAAEDKTLSPYFFVDGDPNVDHLPLKDTRVDIVVSGIIADVVVVQTYRNEGSRPINAAYVFPASTRAAVYGMRMRIGDDIIVAKIKEREEAKQDFEKAKKQGKSASLLEQDRPNVFSMRLANIMPGSEVEIELRYTELLVPAEGVYEVVYPTVVGPRYSSAPKWAAANSDKFVSTPYLREGVKPTSTLRISTKISAGVPIQQLRCPSHQIMPEWKGQTIANVKLDDADGFQGNRDFILQYRLAGEQITSGLLLYQAEGENFFLYMAQPPERVAIESIPPREYIFLVDVSGSMSGFPLNTSIKLLEDLIGGLRPTDFFNVVLFSGDSTALSQKPLEANKENIALAVDLLRRQRANGGTELLPALKQATQLPRKSGVSRSVIVITDGYIAAEDGVFDHIRDNLDECNVFAFGIGSSVNRYLIEGVAKAGMGEPFFVTQESEAAAIATRFRQYIDTPLLTDIQVRADGFEIYDVQPGTFPDLFAQRPIVLFGKWRGPVAGTIKLSGKTGRGDYATILDVTGTQPDEAHSALRYLWARSRIADLSEYGAGYVSDARAKEITALGLKYNLLTKYTSFVAVREKVVNPNGQAKDVVQPLPLPAEVSDLAIGSEPEFVWLLAACLLAAFVFVIRRRGRVRQFANAAVS